MLNINTKVKSNTLKDEFQKKYELMSQFARDYTHIEGEKLRYRKKRLMQRSIMPRVIR